jgi:hypothetical protein
MKLALIYAGLGIFLLGTSAIGANDETRQASKFISIYDSSNAHDRFIAEISLETFYSGLETANLALKIWRKEKPLFCPPDALALHGPQLVSMLRDGVAADQRLGNVEWEFAMLAVMERTFPCKNSK